MILRTSKQAKTKGEKALLYTKVANENWMAKSFGRKLVPLPPKEKGHR
ncbi:hypothetical protein SAMN05444682_101230 [Parapedobacter indicus]|uniref:Uncharacterized protein n=1 Tax=Parapedobacter indicus TaxID=1477437 RepID=A0A1I3CXQ0_9SPHI|nr:hypothetical protein CLV26_101243 [Parapedobacter indicus]SFH79207.1 hypothetical protein SAMN05444682_101230 [Parapedobacter indicus]